MILIYLLIAAGALILTRVLHSHSLMNLVSVLHSAIVLILGLAVLSGISLPGISGFLPDRFGSYQIILTSGIFFLSCIYARGQVEGLIGVGFLEERNLNLFYLGINALLTVCVLIFCTHNLGVLWICIELSTFLSAFLVSILSSKKNIDASLKYIFVTSTAMLFTFMGLLVFYAAARQGMAAGTLDWSILQKNAMSLPAEPLIAAFTLSLIGFAAKAGSAPFHTALPHAYSKAPSAVSAIISSIMLNIGFYGILRIYAIVSGTPAQHAASIVLSAFGILSLTISSLSMLQQKNIKKIIAFSSVEHTGLMLIALGTGTPGAVFWILCHLLAHGLTKALLFFSAGIFKIQYLSCRVDNIKNAFSLQPFASIGLILGSLSISGVPPFIIFTTKLSLLFEIAKGSMAGLAIMLILLTLAAVAFAKTITEAFSTQTSEEINPYQVPRTMKFPIAFLALSLIALGICLPCGITKMLSEICGELLIR